MDRRRDRRREGQLGRDPAPQSRRHRLRAPLRRHAGRERPVPSTGSLPARDARGVAVVAESSENVLSLAIAGAGGFGAGVAGAVTVASSTRTRARSSTTTPQINTDPTGANAQPGRDVQATNDATILDIAGSDRRRHRRHRGRRRRRHRPQRHDGVHRGRRRPRDARRPRQRARRPRHQELRDQRRRRRGRHRRRRLRLHARRQPRRDVLVHRRQRHDREQGLAQRLRAPTTTTRRRRHPGLNTLMQGTSGSGNGASSASTD